MSGDYYKRHDECPGCRPQPYKSYDEFTVALGEWGEKQRLNMAKDWEKIAKDVAANGYRCPCQVDEPICPCFAGVRQAREEGQCACGLFHTGNE